MTVEFTQRRLQALRKHLVLALLGAILGAAVAGYHSPARLLGAGFTELEARLWLYDKVQKPLNRPAPVETQQLISIFGSEDHFKIGLEDQKTWYWHIGGGALAGALAALALFTFLAHPSLILDFFRPSKPKADDEGDAK